MKYAIGIFALMFSIMAQSEQLVFRQNGFKINSLEAQPSGNGNIVFYMLLAPKDSFSPNVNVLTQQYSESLSSYKLITSGQLDRVGATILINRLENESYIFEYLSTQNGQHIHAYSKAILHDGYVYLATATNLESNWLLHDRAMKSVVNSFSGL